jgi:hypothetical protein
MFYLGLQLPSAFEVRQALLVGVAAALGGGCVAGGAVAACLRALAERGMGRGGRTIERPAGRGYPEVRRQDGGSWRLRSRGSRSVLLLGFGEDGAPAPAAGAAPKARPPLIPPEPKPAIPAGIRALDYLFRRDLYVVEGSQLQRTSVPLTSVAVDSRKPC